MNYITRNIEKTITNLVGSFRVIGLTGPRQSGKSTTIRHLLKDKYEYISFDSFEPVNDFQNNPDSFIARYSKYVIFDEVQNVPELFSYIKTAVDNEPDIKGRFILTGSSQFTLNKNITESLAGRIGLISLLPLEFKEIPDDIRDMQVFHGSYPELIINSYRSAVNWYDSYIKTYIERDVRKLQNVGDLRDFQRFLSFISAYAGRQINLTEVSKQIGISIMTVKRWLSVLEASYIIFFLSPYYKNYNKRITKTPKMYFWDTGLAVFLMGLYGKADFENNVKSGQVFENYIVSEILKKIFHSGLQFRIYFYRTSSGKEADLLIECGDEIILAEIKSATFPDAVHIKNLERFDIPAVKKIIIYRGQTIQHKNGTGFINYKELLGSDVLF